MLIIAYLRSFFNTKNQKYLPNHNEKPLSCYKGVIGMDEQFVRDRITQLRLRKGVSEYKMSYDLGHSRGYVHNISSGKATPPLKEFFSICEYFDLTPQQFFDEGTQNPELIQKAVSGMKQLNEKDLLMLLGIINRLLEK